MCDVTMTSGEGGEGSGMLTSVICIMSGGEGAWFTIVSFRDVWIDIG